MIDDDRIIELIIRRYGEVIDVRARRADVLDLVRRFSVADAGNPCAGTPPPPCAIEEGVEFQALTIDDVMRQLLHLSRAVDEIRERLGDA